MRTRYYILSIAPFLIFFVLFSNCTKDDQGRKYYLIQIDSIQVPDQAIVEEPFEIKFYGEVGVTGCSVFSHFETQLDGSDILIKVYKYNEDWIACPAVVVYLRGEVLGYQIYIPGDYQIKVKQPDGSYLTDSIKVVT